MARVDDLSRSLVAFDEHSTLVGVIEMSEKTWLVGGLVPGVTRRPLKKLEPDGEALLGLVARWRDEALSLGFESVASGPLVRSSYHADLLAGTVKPGEASKAV